MSKRPTNGRYSQRTPGLPNTDPKRADARLRDFSGDGSKPQTHPEFGVEPAKLQAINLERKSA